MVMEWASRVYYVLSFEEQGWVVVNQLTISHDEDSDFIFQNNGCRIFHRVDT